MILHAVKWQYNNTVDLVFMKNKTSIFSIVITCIGGLFSTAGALTAAISLVIPVIWPIAAGAAVLPPAVEILPLVAKSLRAPLRLAMDARGDFYVTDSRQGG